MEFDALDMDTAIENTFKKSHIPEGVTIRKNIVRVDKKRLPEILENKILEFYKKGHPLYPIINFYRNLMKNPSEESRKDLFTFLMHNNIPLTEKGFFRAYKKVTHDFTDCKTGTYDNSVGKFVVMPREDVDADRTVTCSTGLHVAAWDYAKYFSSGIMVEVQVNPRDVVSVPIDYNNQKMRVCKYRVIRVVTRPNERILEK
jgi:hypothetical protein